MWHDQDKTRPQVQQKVVDVCPLLVWTVFLHLILHLGLRCIVLFFACLFRMQGLSEIIKQFLEHSLSSVKQ